MPRKDQSTGLISAQAQQDLVSDGIENYELPKSIITKISKSSIPENAKLQKETVLGLVKGSTIFINYLCATSHDVAMSKQHKSVSASDVLKAIEIIEFGDLNDILSAELQIYRNNLKAEKTRKERADKIAAKGKAKEPAAPTVVPTSIDPSLSSASTKGKSKAHPVPEAHVLPPNVLGARDADVPMELAEDGAGGERDIRKGLEPFMDPNDRSASEDEEAAEEDEESEEEPVQDPMVVEQEDLRRDANGLEQRNPAVVAEMDD
ncbi:histone-fold-containing protein [Athelia psychrophila]|uniref:DNA polymerase epsilon subunit D n=1 Tax=Athelia psychrophila TaxID=1759441 RepID=A0A166MG19_9AGAM|nr:histone-fold-containing protein [Fibularhizoctonia sp. CBS 109695]